MDMTLSLYLPVAQALPVAFVGSHYLETLVD